MGVCTHVYVTVFTEHMWCENRRMKLCMLLYLHVSILYGSVVVHVAQRMFACVVFMFSAVPPHKTMMV